MASRYEPWMKFMNIAPFVGAGLAAAYYQFRSSGAQKVEQNISLPVGHHDPQLPVMFPHLPLPSAPTPISALADGRRVQLVYAFALFRHGARTPIHALPGEFGVGDAALWNCSHLATASVANTPGESALETATGGHRYGNCGVGQLTILGEQQMRYIGETFREKYIDGAQLLPATHTDATKLFVRTTHIERTLVTAQRLLDGLYPSSVRHMPISITQKDAREENMYPRRSCARMVQLQKDAYKARLSRVAQQTGLTRELQKALHTADRVRPSDLSNTLEMIRMHSSSLPGELTPELMAKVEEEADWWFSRKFGNTEELSRLSIGRFVGDIVHHIQRAAHDPPAERLAMYVGHDTTLGPLLLALGHRQKVFPPVGSHVVFELYRASDAADMYVRVAYNGESIAQPYCRNATLCPLADFITYAKKIVPVDWEKECLAKDE